MSQPIRHDYGTPNLDYISTWFSREDDGPFWALNLMKYRERAIAADGTVQEAVHDPNAYVLVLIPQVDALAESMGNPVP